ncbi:hypothetical protein TNCV_493031 [Trichonephila clavipes]|nr:hypothetical protein TNCV_493031 [Trichonephila clavipes]
MGDDVMDIHASQSDESLMDDLSPRPSSSGSLRPSGGSPSLGEYGIQIPRCPSDRSFSRGVYCLWGLLSLVNTGFTNPGNPSEPSLFSALFLAIQISLSFFSTSGAHFRVSTGGHVPEVPE